MAPFMCYSGDSVRLSFPLSNRRAQQEIPFHAETIRRMFQSH